MNDQCALLKSLSDVSPVLEGVTASGRVSGTLFELSVEQRYRNPGRMNIEAIYTFPLPWGATLLSLEFEIGGKRLEGVIVEKKAAQERYEKALDQGDTAVLLECSAEGLYTVNVGNLLPGESAVVRYRYAQLLEFVKGRVRLAVPTVIAPRYGDAMAAGGLEAQQVPVTHLLAEYPFAIDIEIEGPLANGQLTSPSHRIGLRRTERGIRASLAGKGFLDRDFVLAIEEIESTATATVAKDGDSYVVHAAFCPTISLGDAKPSRALKILVDCSGSMAGSSIAGAKRALHEILSRLEPQDRFSVARFGDNFQPINGRLVPATDVAIGMASKAVSSLVEADLGGTRMAEALEALLKQDHGERADVLLITDGQVWNVDTVIAKAKEAGQRIFVVGIGAAPAQALLERLAVETGGATEFVAPNEDAAGTITRMFLRSGQPPATAVCFQIAGSVIWESQIPRAIYDGETIHLFAGLSSEPTGEVVLEFEMADRNSGRQVVPLTFATEPGSLPRVAASRRLLQLPENEQVALAVRYGLVSDKTSLVLVHVRAAGEKATALPTTIAVPQMMAAGWGGVAVLGAEDRSMFSRSMNIAARDQVDYGISSYRCPKDDSRARELPDSPFIIEPRVNMIERLRNAFFNRDEDVTPGRLMDLLADTPVMLDVFRKRGLPRTLKDLQRLRVSRDVLGALRELVRRGYSERIVVNAFLEFIATFSDGSDAHTETAGRIASLFDGPDDGRDARALVQQVLDQTTPMAWRVRDKR
jgi:Ca-activated chloride channel family protein